MVVDLQSPSRPTVVQLTTADTTPSVTGTFDSADAAELTIVVKDEAGATTLATYTTADDELVLSGNTWTLNLPTTADAVYQIEAFITDEAGNNSGVDVTLNDLTVDASGPANPTVDYQVTNNQKPVITGTWDSSEGGDLSVTVGPYSFTLSDAELTTAGNVWTLDLSGVSGTGLNEDIYNVVAIHTDLLGASSTDTGTTDLNIDLTGPLPTPTVNSLTTNDLTPTVTGTYPSGDAAGGLSVEVDGNTYTLGVDPELTAAGGIWTLNLDGTTPLAENTYDVTVTVTDAAGNTRTDASNLELTVDASVPTVTYQVTDNTNPTISGTAPPGATLTIQVNGGTSTGVVADGSGNWSIDTTTMPGVGVFTDGDYDVVATITSGGAGVDVGTVDLTIDTLNPDVPTVVSQVTDAISPIITGSMQDLVGDGPGLAPGETLTVVVHGRTYIDVVVDASGNWTIDTSLAPDSGTPLAFLDATTYTVTATVTDSAGNTAVGSGTVEIDRTPNVLPTSDSVSASGDEETTISITLSGSDTDGMVDNFQITALPTDGVLYTDAGLTNPVALNTNIPAASESLTLCFAPSTDFAGTSTFTYVAVDNEGGQDASAATATLTVNNLNDAPVANNDTASTPEDTAVDIDVLLNDTDADGDALSVTGTPSALNGTVTINVDGTLNYDPAGDFTGSDTITYQVTDGTETRTATVKVTVTPVNDAPAAVDDNASTSEDVVLNSVVDLDANDTDVDGDTLTVVAGTFATAEGGSIDIAVDGSYTYTPPSGFSGVYSVVYTVSDGALSDTATLTITVNASGNAEPVAVGDSYTVAEDGTLTTTLGVDGVLFNDSDADLDALTVETTPVSGPSNGLLTLSSNGTFTYTPDANFNGIDSFTYRVSDGNGGTDTAVATITVTSVDDLGV